MTKAEEILSKQCNRYVNGQCMTLHCLERGGYNRQESIKNKITADYNKATCEIHEAILEIRALESKQNINPANPP